MPNSAASLSRSRFSSSNAARLRFAQRSESCIDSRAAAWSAGYAVHSSNTMTMSAPSASCISIERSGVSSIRSPLTGERNSTPFSVILRRLCRLQT